MADAAGYGDDAPVVRSGKSHIFWSGPPVETAPTKSHTDDEKERRLQKKSRPAASFKGKKKARPGERAGLFLSIYRMRQCSIVE